MRLTWVGGDASTAGHTARARVTAPRAGSGQPPASTRESPASTREPPASTGQPPASTGQPPARAATPVLSIVPALLVALLGGVALAAAFPPAGIWPLAAVGPAVLAIVLWGRSLRGASAAGFAFGLGFFFPLLSWLVNVAWYAWSALAVAEAVVFAVLAVGQRLLLRLPGWPLAVAGWWVAAEAVRARWPWGFPWGRLAMSQAQAPTARWVAIGGPPLLSLLLALAGATLAWLVLSLPPLARRETGAQAARIVVPAASLVTAAGLALAGGLLPVDVSSVPATSADVAAVQGDVPHERNLPNLLRASEVTQNHAAATEQLAAEIAAGRRPAPQVVIWPENSTDLDPLLYPGIYGMIAKAVNVIRSPVLVGAVLQDPLRNTGQLWLPGRGPVQIYVKRQLVPFGEYIPMRGLLDKITSLPDLQPVNFTPGHKAVVFRIGKIRLGDVICYEVGFDNLVASEVTAGANLLTMQTNDADFEIDGQLGETEQQLAMARLRAIEFDRSVVVASTTGESAIIAPNGSLIAHSGTWRRALLDARVPLRSVITPAARAGQWPEYGMVAATAAALLAAIGLAVADRRRRGRGNPG